MTLGQSSDGWSGKYVTAAQVAAYLSVHVRTVHRYAADGRLTPYRVADTRAVRFRRREVEALLRRRNGEGEEGAS